MIRIFSIILGTLSLTVLVRDGFGLEFKTPGAQIIDYYELSMQWLFEWIEPFVRMGVSALPISSDWDGQHVHAHWKHFFVLIWLFFAAHIKLSWGGSVFRLVYGGIISFAVAALTGTIALDNRDTAFLLLVIPISGVALYALGDTLKFVLFDRGAKFFLSDPDPRLRRWWFWNSFSLLLRIPVYFVVPGIVVIVVGTQAEHIPYLRTSPNPELLLLAVFIVVVELCWLLTALPNPQGAIDQGQAPWLQRFAGDAYVHAALSVLFAMAAAILLVSILN